VALSDADLIARVLDRDDRHAFGLLVRRYQSQIRALLRRLTCGDEALADDLAQQAFVRAYRGLRGYRGGAKLSSWLYRIAYNVFLTDRGRRREQPVEVEEAPSPAPGPEATAMLRFDLARAMVTLTPMERAAVTLAYSMDATHEDVAAILDCPLGTAKTHIHRARGKLRQRLQHWRQEASP
jgi:RNA polymerase sigma-70 factor (ECF subfamily)